MIVKKMIKLKDLDKLEKNFKLNQPKPPFRNSIKVDKSSYFKPILQ